MAEMFTRTPSGIVAKWRFHDVPTIWVEGPTDILFYLPIVDLQLCRLEAFGGVSNAKALIADLLTNQSPYVVIVDGDYEMLNSDSQTHPNIISLRRYSFENYLWEPSAINSACLRHAQIGEQDDLLITNMHNLESTFDDKLREIVVLDVAARTSDSCPKVLPERIERLLADDAECTLNDHLLSEIEIESRKLLKPKKIIEARNLVDRYLKDRRFFHIFRGHLVFGVLRKRFIAAANKRRGTKSVIPDDALIQILSDAIWKTTPHSDHLTLKQSIADRISYVWGHSHYLSKSVTELA